VLDVLAATGLAASAALASCTTESGGEPSPSPGTTAAAIPTRESTATANAPTPGAVPESEGWEAMRELGALAASATYYVVYEIDGRDNEGGWDGVVTTASEPPRRHYRYDPGYAPDARHYVFDGLVLYDCQGEAADAACSPMPPGLIIVAPPPFGDLIQLVDALRQRGMTSAVEVANRTVAGQPARCFEMAETIGSRAWSGTACAWTGNGVLLLIEGELPGFEGQLIARQALPDVPPGTFDLPFRVVR
jgi:hypothetical protein